LGKLKGRDHLGRHVSRWEYNVRMCLKEIELEGVEWMQLAQVRDQW